MSRHLPPLTTRASFPTPMRKSGVNDLQHVHSTEFGYSKSLLSSINVIFSTNIEFHFKLDIFSGPFQMTIPKWPCHLHIPQAREGPHVDRKALSTVRCHNNHKIQFRTNLKAGKQHDTSARSFVYHST